MLKGKGVVQVACLVHAQVIFVSAMQRNGDDVSSESFKVYFMLPRYNVCFVDLFFVNRNREKNFDVTDAQIHLNSLKS